MDGVLFWTDTFSMVPVETSIGCFQANRDVSFRGGSEKWKEISDITRRIDYLVTEGVEREVLLPDGGLLWRVRDRQTRAMCFDIYNAYADEIESTFRQFVMPKIIDSYSADVALAQTKRILYSTNASNCIVIDMTFIAKIICNKDYSDFFEVLNESRCTIVLHANGFQSQTNFSYPYSAKTTMFCVNAMSLIIDAFMSGFFDRYSGIKFFFSEVGYKWLEHLSDKIPFYIERYFSLESITPVSRSFSDVIKNSLAFSFTNDLPCAFFLEKYSESLVFGSDFPHADSSYGNTREHVRKIGEISEELCEMVFSKNAIKLLMLC